MHLDISWDGAKRIICEGVYRKDAIAEARGLKGNNGMASGAAFTDRVSRRLDRVVHDIGVRIAAHHGGAFYQSTPDRTVLECKILPFYQLSADHSEIVFVGTEWYTFGYARLFAHKRFTTIDILPDRARHGAPRHIVAPMEELAAHFDEQSVDVVFCNGVVGWGLDRLEDGRKAFDAAMMILRPGGHLVLGWNALSDHAPFSAPDLARASGFEPITLPSLGAAHIAVEGAHQHHFDIFVRPI